MNILCSLYTVGLACSPGRGLLRRAVTKWADDCWAGCFPMSFQCSWWVWQAREAPVQRLADRVAGRFCYTVMAASAATFASGGTAVRFRLVGMHPGQCMLASFRRASILRCAAVGERGSLEQGLAQCLTRPDLARRRLAVPAGTGRGRGRVRGRQCGAGARRQISHRRPGHRLPLRARPGHADRGAGRLVHGRQKRLAAARRRRAGARRAGATA